MNRKGAGVAWVEIFFFPPHRHPLGWGSSGRSIHDASLSLEAHGGQMHPSRQVRKDPHSTAEHPLSKLGRLRCQSCGFFFGLIETPANSLRSQPARGLASLTRVGGHTLQRQILLGGDCCRHPSDPRFGHATTSFLRAQRTMINPTPRLYQ